MNPLAHIVASSAIGDLPFVKFALDVAEDGKHWPAFLDVYGVMLRYLEAYADDIGDNDTDTALDALDALVAQYAVESDPGDPLNDF